MLVIFPGKVSSETGVQNSNVTGTPGSGNTTTTTTTTTVRGSQEPSSQNASSISGPTSTGDNPANAAQPAETQKPDKDIRTKQVTTP